MFRRIRLYASQGFPMITAGGQRKGTVMSKREIVSLALVLAGIYVAVQALGIVSYAGIQLHVSSFESFLELMMMLFALGVMALIVYVLIVYSNAIARRLVPEEPEMGAGEAPASRNVQAIAFSVVGLALLACGVPKLVAITATTVHMPAAPDNYIRTISMRQWIRPAAEVILGAVLFVKATPLSDWWQRLQRGDDGAEEHLDDTQGEAR